VNGARNSRAIDNDLTLLSKMNEKVIAFLPRTVRDPSHVYNQIPEAIASSERPYSERSSLHIGIDNSEAMKDATPSEPGDHIASPLDMKEKDDMHNLESRGDSLGNAVPSKTTVDIMHDPLIGSPLT
jgi:hypothetical protein